MALTIDQQLAAAFCEQVYRRDDLDQQIGNASAPVQGYDNLGGGTPIIYDTDIAEFTRDKGFFYNDKTGFVGQIIEANGSVFVVFRGVTVTPLDCTP